LSTDIKSQKASDELVEKWLHGYRRGSLRFFILHLLLHKSKHGDAVAHDISHKEKFHGYHLAKRIDKATEGKWHPTTASIYPILKQFKEDGVIEEVPDIDEQESKRLTKNYRLTPFGVKVAEKLENARKDFTKAFIVSKGKPPPLLALKLKDRFSDDEILELMKELDLEVLEKEKNHLKEGIQILQKTLERLEEEITKRRAN
jgi:DNA-binding PadR family transcriptional regulator